MKERARVTKNPPHGDSSLERNGRQKEVPRRRSEVQHRDRSGCEGEEKPRDNEQRGKWKRDDRNNRTPQRSKLPSRIPVKTSSSNRKPPIEGGHPNHTNTSTTSSRVTAPNRKHRTTRVRAVDPDLEVRPIRPPSPPVPALARKLGIAATTSKHEATAAQRDLEPSPPPARKVCSSPPVPALAKKLALTQTETRERESAAVTAEAVPADYTDIEETPSRYRSSSPPVPTLARRLHAQSTNDRSSPAEEPSPPISHGSDCLPINRRPSCSPIPTPLPPTDENNRETAHVHLPALVTSAPPPNAHCHPDWPNGQERVLQGLAALRHVSQKASIAP